MINEKGNRVQYYTRKELKKLISVLDAQNAEVPRKGKMLCICFPFPDETSMIQVTIHTARTPDNKTLYKAEYIKRETGDTTMKTPVQEAIEMIQKKIAQYKQEIEKVGEKRINNYRSYATFNIEGEMEAHAHLEVLTQILERLEGTGEIHDMVADLIGYQESIKREVLIQRIGFSTSQTDNLYRIIEKNVHCEYIKDRWGTINNVINILLKVQN
jgi:hypothetical protein